MRSLQVGAYTITWLNGGDSQLDGGAMFGVVPKVMWTKKYPCSNENLIPMRNDPLLIQGHGRNLLVDSGMGVNKMNEKQLKHFGVREQSNLEKSLKEKGLHFNDIDTVLMTHLHFDHASGLTTKKDDELHSVFSKADIYVSEIEWHEMRNPNIRSRNTYIKENWEPIASQIHTFEKEVSILPGLKMVHTGGHSDGHSIVVIESNGETLLHLGDILPTHAHQNVLWVMAYDDYPMNSIARKQQWITYGVETNAWFSFYHDAIFRAVKWDSQGQIKERVLV